MDRVKGKVAIVTGGSVGIGQSACNLLAREGASVAVTDVLDSEGQETACRIREAGGKAEFWHLDVRKESEVRAVFQGVSDHFGGIAGANRPTHEITEQEWDDLMAVNVKGVLFCTKHAIPYMQKVKRGSIINLSSIYGIVGAGDVPPYHASKGAVRLMTKNDALTYAPDNIRVNSIYPGFIWTPMVEKFAGEQGDIVEMRKQLDALHPIGHVGEPDDIGSGIVYLASEEAKFITGSELVIDGGYTAR